MATKSTRSWEGRGVVNLKTTDLPKNRKQDLFHGKKFSNGDIKGICNPQTTVMLNNNEKDA